MNLSFRRQFLLTEAKTFEQYLSKWKKQGIDFTPSKDLEDALKILQRRNKYNDFFSSGMSLMPNQYDRNPKQYEKDIIEYAKQFKLRHEFEQKYKDVLENQKKAAKMNKKMNIVFENENYAIIAPFSAGNSVNAARYDFDKEDWLEDDENYKSEDEANYPSHAKVDPTWCIAARAGNTWKSYGCDKDNYNVFYVLSKKSYNHRWAICLKNDKNDINVDIEDITTSNFIDEIVKEIREPLQKRTEYNLVWETMLKYLKTNGVDILKTCLKYYDTEKPKFVKTSKNNVNLLELCISNAQNGGVDFLKTLSFTDLANNLIDNNANAEKVRYELRKLLLNEPEVLKKLYNTRLADGAYFISIAICTEFLGLWDDDSLKLIEVPIITPSVPYDFQLMIMTNVKEDMDYTNPTVERLKKLDYTKFKKTNYFDINADDQENIIEYGNDYNLKKIFMSKLGLKTIKDFTFRYYHFDDLYNFITNTTDGDGLKFNFKEIKEFFRNNNVKLEQLFLTFIKTLKMFEEHPIILKVALELFDTPQKFKFSELLKNDISEHLLVNEFIFNFSSYEYRDFSTQQLKELVAEYGFEDLVDFDIEIDEGKSNNSGVIKLSPSSNLGSILIKLNIDKDNLEKVLKTNDYEEIIVCLSTICNDFNDLITDYKYIRRYINKDVFLRNISVTKPDTKEEITFDIVDKLLDSIYSNSDKVRKACIECDYIMIGVNDGVEMKYLNPSEILNKIISYNKIFIEKISAYW